MTSSARTQFHNRLKQGVLIGDGAMATLLYQFGVPARASFEALCVTEPEMVRHVHKEYIDAGAQLLQTNSFSSNRLGLTRYGLENQVAEINRASVRIARDAANGRGLVFGTVGPTSDFYASGVPAKLERTLLRDVFEEQISALLEESVDGLLLETFADLHEVLLALETARALTDVPIIANLSPDAIGVTRDGVAVQDAFSALVDRGADVVGLNCRLGLSGILRTYEKLPRQDGVIYSAVPNAGMLHMVDGHYSYTAGEDFFAEVGKELVQQGVTVLGGCCGTTPKHIRKLTEALKLASLHTGVLTQSVVHDEGVVVTVSPQDMRERALISTVRERATDCENGTVEIHEHREFSLLDAVKKRTTVVVELDPPRTLDVAKYISGALALKDAGADSVTMADNSLGRVRVSNMALATIVKKFGIEPLVHVTCRDRNLIGQQSHLMGLHVLGMRHILLVTGDPTRFGDLPGAASVYDVSSIELTAMVKRLNAGIGFSGQELRTPSNFVIGTSFNPNVPNFSKAVERLKRKVDAGADYVMTQPIFDPRMFEVIKRVVEPFNIPVFVGVMPITSARNALFLHNEVPGIQLTDEIISRMKMTSKDTATEVGLAIARDLLDEATKYFHGIYLVTPFLRYDLTHALTHYAKSIKPEAKIG